MKPRTLLGRSGVIRTQPRFRWPAWLWPANAVAALIALYGVVTWLDDMDDIERDRRAAALLQARAEGFEAGRKAGETQMLDTARAAWQAAITEGEYRCAWRRP